MRSSSGSGKSTLCRAINRLETIDDGEITVDGAVLPAEGKALAKLRADVGMVFQSFNLFAHKSIVDNVSLGPVKVRKSKPAEAKKLAMELLERVGVANQANKLPAQLSGGQQQRIAIARALATNPDVLLCDEATSALDPKTTHAILGLIREINAKLGITVIVITHQMSVVQEICNRVAILENGAVVEEGEVAEVFANPKAEATKNLVYPEMADANVALGDKHGQRVRIIFNGAIAANEPLIAKMAMEVGIAASILGASTRAVGDRAYGYILLEIPGGPDELAKAVNFLRQTPDVTVQVQVDYAAKEDEA